jgi:sugar porter (SP) family MFS transporter
MFKGRALYIAQVILVVFPSFFLFGYNQVGIGGLLSFESWTKAFPQIDTTHASASTKSHKSVIQGVYVSSFTLGALAGSLSCSLTGDVLGRRKTIFLGGIFTLIGEVVSCTSFQLPQLLIGRIITGIGIGILFTMVPVWQAECSKPTNRGKHVVVDGIFISSGFAASYWINFGFSHIDQYSVSWRVPVAMPVVLSIVLISSVFLFPESPRWLVRVGQREKAVQQLARIRDTGTDATEVQREIASIEFSLEETAQTAATFKDIFTMKDGKLFYRFMLCLGLQFWIQMTGASVISTYSTTIFREDLGLSNPLSRILGASALTWKCLASFVSFFTIDHFGRRKLFLFCGVGITLCMTSMAITSSFSSKNHAASVADAFFLFLFNFFFPIGLLGPSFLYCTEVAPIRLRVAMTSISTANHWLWCVFFSCPS